MDYGRIPYMEVSETFKNVPYLMLTEQLYVE